MGFAAIESYHTFFEEYLFHEDTGDFSVKVLRLLRDRALRERLSAEGRDCVRDWSARRMAEHMAEFYREVIAGRLAAAA